MIVHKLNSEFRIHTPVVTVGTFDGVHLGHAQILQQLIKQAHTLGGESVVLTFYPHPRTVLFPDMPLYLLNTIEEKIDRFEKFNIDHFVILPFSVEFSKLISCDFIYQILHKQLNTKHLIVGYDHRFGHDRQGDVAMLKQCTQGYGFDVERVEAFNIEGVPVSSTKIRHALENGEISRANAMLGYKYGLRGIVTHGEHIGHELGFPTANIELPENNSKLLPKNGVYAVMISIDNQNFNGMLNIGTRPTVSDKSEINIEAHLFNFDGNLYGKTISVEFYDYIRPEIKFLNKSELRNQLQTDKEQISSFFGNR